MEKQNFFSTKSGLVDVDLHIKLLDLEALKSSDEADEGYEGKILSPTDVQRIKVVLESKHKLLNKYLPDLKQSDVSMDMDGRMLLERTEKRLDGTVSESS